MESLLNMEKILQDNRQDPMQSHKIVQQFYEILSQLWKGSCSIIDNIT